MVHWKEEHLPPKITELALLPTLNVILILSLENRVDCELNLHVSRRLSQGLNRPSEQLAHDSSSWATAAAQQALHLSFIHDLMISWKGESRSNNRNFSTWLKWFQKSDFAQLSPICTCTEHLYNLLCSVLNKNFWPVKCWQNAVAKTQGWVQQGSNNSILSMQNKYPQHSCYSIWFNN